MELLDADRLMITPALALCSDASGRQMDTIEARVMLIAIALQESRFEHRRQIRGPARGYWQFEHMGGVAGVMRHPASQPIASAIITRMDYPWSARDVYNALEFDGVLAAVFARLLLWTDRDALPEVTRPGDAWDYYIRNWRPGKPHPETWQRLHAQAVGYVTE